MKKVTKGTLQRDNYHAQNRGAFRTQSNIQDGAFCENDLPFSQKTPLYRLLISRF